MKRFLNITFSIIALVILVAIIAIGSLAYFIDPNKMRPVLVEEVMNRTGYQLAIYGKLNWRLFPTVGINVQRMTLAGPNQLEPFIDLRNVTVASDLAQLLHGSKELQGDVRIADMKFMDMHIENTHIKLDWSKDVLTISPIKAYMYGGTLSGVAHGSQLNEVPKWNWDVKLDGVQMQPLLQDLNHNEARLNIRGKGHVEMTGSTKGMAREQLITNLDGAANFKVDDGSVQGLDVNYLIETADALINKRDIKAPAESVQDTKFDSFSGTLTVKNGVASTNNILLTAPAFTTKGEGTLNLLYQAINFALQVKLDKNSHSKLEVPILVTGNLKSPNIRIDLNEVQRSVTQAQINRVKEKVSNEITKRVPGKAGEALQNLLGS